MPQEIQMLLQPRLVIYQKYLANIEHPLHKAVRVLVLTSDFACRNLEILCQLLEDEDCLKPWDYADYYLAIHKLSDQTLDLFLRDLRRFRHYHLLRLMLRELAGLATTEQTMAAWSAFADIIILKTLDFCQQTIARRYGQPCDETGRVAQLYVLAMGKLGGSELNYSSDIDLIFTFSAAGRTDGPESLSNQQYYSKVVQLFVQYLQSPTQDGFVFRVDLRLRPNGDSGALVSSLTAMENYYQEQGRDWERYAMVKARLLGESPIHANHWFHCLITPFVYRRYVDFSVIESLRSMKTMIERELLLNPGLNDIKRGVGGIREIEFIIQNIQLVRGGRLPQLRQQNALLTLAILKQGGLLARTSALKQAYLFLRKLENILQSLNNQQTHSLPEDEIQQAQVALAMGYKQWSALKMRLEQYCRIVRTIFSSMLQKMDVHEDEDRLIAHQLASFWHGHIDDTVAINLLASLGFQNAERCYQLLYAFRHAPRCRRLSQAARLRLDRFMVLLLSELRQVKETDSVLLQVLQLLENIVGRSAYLALLTENPAVLKELLYWFENSPFITSLLVTQPFLLEILLTNEANSRLPSRQELEQKLKNQLLHCSENELQDETLRQFKLNNWLLAARAEMAGQYDAIRIARFLTEVAAIIVLNVLDMASQRLAKRYPEIAHIKTQFAIIAYGKLGSREMNYNSDLDLVFIHATLPTEEHLINRLTQKILHMLTTRSQAGILYAVDTRLRPSGSAGLLVSHMDAFANYQRTEAWTWEHQALLRARILSANKRMRHTFKTLKQDVLFLPRDKKKLYDEVLAMRAKINRYSNTEHIKYTAGGLLDLEFLVHFLVLANPRQNLTRYTNTLSLLQKLYAEKIINQVQFKKLKQAYQHYHSILHHDLLQPDEYDSSAQQTVVKGLFAEAEKLILSS